MAFDPIASRVVLFGGGGANEAGLNDTWLWDGTDWTQAADTGPDPRAGSAMVAATTIVLFGGVNSIDPDLSQANRIIYGDSWRWDGKVWTKVQDIGPTPRWGHGMAFQSDTGQIVLFGGSSVFGPAEDGSLQAGVMRDTWEHPEVAGGTGVEVKSVAATGLIHRARRCATRGCRIDGAGAGWRRQLGGGRDVRHHPADRCIRGVPNPIAHGCRWRELRVFPDGLQGGPAPR